MALSVVLSSKHKTETEITMKWTANQTVTRERHRRTASGNWTSWKTVNAKSGTFSYTCDANTTYPMQIQVETASESATASVNVKTYSWPTATISNVVLRDGVNIVINNPLSRRVGVKVFAENTLIWSDTEYYGEIYFGGGYSEEGAPTLFLPTIPNKMTGNWYVQVTYSGNTTTTATKTFSAKGCNPKVTSALYADSNATAQAVIQDPSKILQNVSTPEFTIAGSARCDAHIRTVDVEFPNGLLFETGAINDVATLELAPLPYGSNTTASVTVTDTRGNTSDPVSVPVKMLKYTLPSATISLNRLNNYYSETNLEVDASVMDFDGRNVPTITAAWRETGTSAWSSPEQVIPENQLTSLNPSQGGLDNTKAWDVRVTITDTIGGVKRYTRKIGIGLPIWFIDKDLRSIGMNDFPTAPNQFIANGKILTDLGVADEATISSRNISSSTGMTELTETAQLAPGTYLVIINVEFASNNSGRRVVGLSTTSGQAPTNALNVQRSAPVSGAATTVRLVNIIRPTTARSFYINVGQNSGSQLATSGAYIIYRLV